MPECKNDKDPCDVLPLAGEAWSVCLPFGGRLWADGNGVHAQGGIAPPDGVYGKVVIANGCLVGVEPEDVPLYTGSPCAPLPGNCGGAAAAVASDVAAFADAPVAVVSIEAGAHVTVRGLGTDDDPYVISADTGVYLHSENHAISVTGEGTRENPLRLAHKTGYSGTVNGMSFDAFGHLVSASTGPTAGTKGLTGIIPGYGIAVNMDNALGIATVGMQPPPNAVKMDDAQFGAFRVNIDEMGRITRLKQTIDTTPATLACGSMDLYLNATGTITGFTETLDTGASYLCVWGKPETPQIKRGARFSLRVGTALVGLCVSDADMVDSVFYLDGQPCGRVGKMFWGSGVYVPGAHVIEIMPAPDAAMAVLLYATALATETW